MSILRTLAFVACLTLLVATVGVSQQTLDTKDRLVGEWVISPSFEVRSSDGQITANRDSATQYPADMRIEFGGDGTGTITSDDEFQRFVWSVEDGGKIRMAYVGYESRSLILPIDDDTVLMLEEQESRVYGAVLHRAQ